MEDYLCISCKYNYYGNCKKKNINRLKQNNIQKCESYEIEKHFIKNRVIKFKRIKNN